MFLANGLVRKWVSLARLKNIYCRLDPIQTHMTLESVNILTNVRQHLTECYLN